MKLTIIPILGLATAFALAGCGRKESEPLTQIESDPYAPSATASEPGQMSAMGGYTRLPTETQDPVTDPAGAIVALPQAAQPIEGRVHPFMTSQLRIFINEKRRMPESFAEFANARMDSVPFPPEGMEYAIDYQSRQVKIVPSKR
jgi:predicted small lipoprotein YifL